MNYYLEEVVSKYLFKIAHCSFRISDNTRDADLKSALQYEVNWLLEKYSTYIDQSHSDDSWVWLAKEVSVVMGKKRNEKLRSQF